MTLKELCNNATPRPWVAHCGTKQGIVIDSLAATGTGFRQVCFAVSASDADAALIAHAVNVLPALLEASKKLTAGCESYLAANGHTLRISGMLAVQKAIADAEEVK